MKAIYIISILCWLNIGIGLSESAVDKFFDKYANEDQVTSVYISKSMMELLPVQQMSFGWDFSSLAGKIDAINVLSTENEKVSKKMRQEFDKLTKEPSYEQLMWVKDEDSLVKVYVCKNKKGNKISELLLVADSDDEFYCIRLTGNFTLENLRSITNKPDRKEKND